MPSRETTPSRDAGKEGDIRSIQTAGPKRKLDFVSVPETREAPPTAAHQIATRGLPGVFGVPEPRDETPPDLERQSKRAKLKGKGRATEERPSDAASSSQVAEGGTEAQSTQASDAWTVNDYSHTIGTLDEVQKLSRGDLNLPIFTKNKKLKALREMIPKRGGTKVAINSNEFVQKWDELAQSANEFIKKEMSDAILRQQTRHKPEPRTPDSPLRWK